MVASSEQHNAPVIVSKPARAHASRSHPGAPFNRDDSAEVIKIPDPIIDPITIIVASIGPSARIRLDDCRLSFLSVIVRAVKAQASFANACLTQVGRAVLCTPLHAFGPRRARSDAPYPHRPNRRRLLTLSCWAERNTSGRCCGRLFQKTIRDSSPAPAGSE